MESTHNVPIPSSVLWKPTQYAQGFLFRPYVSGGCGEYQGYGPGVFCWKHGSIVFFWYLSGTPALQPLISLLSPAPDVLVIPLYSAAMFFYRCQVTSFQLIVCGCEPKHPVVDRSEMLVTKEESTIKSQHGVSIATPFATGLRRRRRR